MVGYYILAISVLASLLVGLLVVANSAKGRQGQIYIALTVSFISLSVANALSFDARVDQLFFMRLVMFSATMSAYAIYLLVRAMQSGKIFSGSLAVGFMITTAIVAALDWTPLVFSDFIPTDPPQPVPAAGAIIFFVHFISLVTLSIYSLVRGMRALHGVARKHLQSLAIGLTPIVLIAPVTGFILPLIFHISGLAILSPLYTFIFVVFVGYAIARQGLFDIKQAAIRSLVYGFSILTLGLLYYGLAYFISATLFKQEVERNIGFSIVNILLALLLAFIFQPIKRFFDRITNKIFYRNGYDTGDFLIRLGRILTSTTELREILDQVGKEIRSTLKASGSLFLIYRDHHPNELVGEGINKQFSQAELATLQAITSASEGGLLTVDKLITSKLPHAQALHALLTKKHIVYVLPLVTADETIGYFMLGENLAGMYTKQDTEALKAIANELVIAVQNARSVQAIRDLNASLEERIESATEELRASNKKLIELDEAKDEFVSMASHQLRTPLTSVKGYISMVLEGDTGDITPMQRKLLEEAFASSERMVHLISDFLNVSRLQTGKFVIDTTKVDLAELVGQEVAGLEATAKVRSLKLHYRKPAYFPVLYIDEGKIRQVLMNFIDNAIYYSTERTTITVKLRVEDGDAVLEVHDTGIGVPKSEQQRLFTKFFRATNARRQRPDGTGIGLFLAKKVIVAHGGSMVFESTEGEGSVFGFRLPIKKLSEVPPVRTDPPL